MYQVFIVYPSLPQYLLPAIVHINHQPYLERGDGPIVSGHTFLVVLNIFMQN